MDSSGKLTVNDYDKSINGDTVAAWSFALSNLNNELMSLPQ